VYDLWVTQLIDDGTEDGATGPEECLLQNRPICYIKQWAENTLGILQDEWEYTLFDILRAEGDENDDGKICYYTIEESAPCQ